MRCIVLVGLLGVATLCRAGCLEWRASWIGTERCQSLPNTWLAYRKEVALTAVPDTLIACIAADSKYWLWVNGQLVVFEGGLKRGPGPGAVYYDRMDIAPYLSVGQNTLAVLVWHFGKNGFSHAGSGTAALFFQAIGEDVEILSDRSWQCTLYDAWQTAEGVGPDYRLPESNLRFDARLAMNGWEQPDYRGRGFEGCLIVGSADCSPAGTLVERPIPLWKDSGLRDYEQVVRQGDTLRCRLPYNAQVTPYLKVNAPAGKVIGMQTDHYWVGSTPTIRAEYVTCDGVQQHESLGWMNGEEMLYIVPEGVEVLDVKYRETGYDAQLSGCFACDDTLLCELWRRAQRTLYLTMRDTYMDCPDRERAQWLGDETIELGEAFYALSPSGWQLADKGIREVMGWQRADGTIYGPVPTGNFFKELPLQMLAFVGWYGFYTQYFFSGDSTFIPLVYDGLHRYLHEVWQLDADGFPVPRAGEWDWGDWGRNIDMELLTTCWYSLALRAERHFARILGREHDAQTDSLLMDRMERGFDRRYWTGTAFRSPGYGGQDDDRAQVMAVLARLATADKYEAVCAVLDSQQHASPYMEKYVLEALFYMGEAQRAIERMRRRYAHMIGDYPDCTTLFEYWALGGGGSANHAWTGGPLTLLSQWVCGIRPTAPGFRTFEVCPQMGPLTQASATVDTRYGLISVALQREGDSVRVVLDVPLGTVAEVPLTGGGSQRVGSGQHRLIIPAQPL